MRVSDTCLDVGDLVKDLPALVPAKRAAEFLGTTTRTLRRWVAEERLQVLKTSPTRPGRILVPRTEIHRILAEMVA